MHQTESTWVVAHLRSAERLAREDAETSERLARQIQAGLDASDREQGICTSCGRIIPRLSNHSKCESCREREARRRRNRREVESPEAKADRLAQRRVVEKARRDRLRAAGVRKEADRKAKQRAVEKALRAQQRQAETALRRLEGRGIILRGTGI